MLAKDDYEDDYEDKDEDEDDNAFIFLDETTKCVSENKSNLFSSMGWE